LPLVNEHGHKSKNQTQEQKPATSITAMQFAITGGMRFVEHALFRIIFIIGNTSGELQESVEREAKMHGDFLQITAPDAYR